MKTHSTIEWLEPRIAPAGILNLISKNGLVTITEDKANPGAQDLHLAASEAGVSFSVDATTKLRVNGTLQAAGGSVSLPGITSINVNLGAEADTIDFHGLLSGTLTADLGSGTGQTASITAARMGGVIVKNSGSTDLSSSTIAGSVAVTGTAGSVMSISDNDDLGGTFSFKAAALGTFTLATGKSLVIGGNATIALGAAGNITANAGSLTVGGSLLVTSSAALAPVKAPLATVQALPPITGIFGGAGDFHIAGGATFITAGTSEGFNTSGTLQVGKQLTLQAAKGATPIQFAEGDAGVSIGGKLTMTGAKVMEVISNIGNILIAGAMTLTGKGSGVSETVSAKGSLEIGGSATLTATSTGGANQSITSTDTDGTSFIDGPTKMLGGTIVALAVGGDLHGAVTITTKKVAAADAAPIVHIGSTSATVRQRVFAPVTVTVNGLANHQGLLDIQNITLTGALKATMGAGADTVAITDSFLTGKVSIDVGAGDDLIKLDSTTGSSSATGYYLGALTLKGGAGNDTAEFGGPGATETAVFGGKLTLPADIETYAIDPHAAFIQRLPLV